MSESLRRLQDLTQLNVTVLIPNIGRPRRASIFKPGAMSPETTSRETLSS